MRIYIVRHGETQWNKEEVFRGRKDVPLNGTGKRQARMAGAYFADIPLDRVLSSPLQRAMETAEPMCAATGAAVETLDELIDMDFGVWEGLPLKEVEERYPAGFDLWKRSPQKLRIKRGETLAGVRRRVSAGLAKAATPEEGTIAIVTHRVICKVLVLLLLGMGNEHFWHLKYDPGSITLLEKARANTLVFSNDTCHLREVSPGTIYRDF